MKAIKKGVFLLLILTVLLSFSVSASTNFSIQNSYDWLAEEADSEGSYNSDVYLTALAVMALDNGGYDTSLSEAWLINQMDTSSYCLASGSCTVIDTASTALAFDELQSTSFTDYWETWFYAALDDSDLDGSWYLEVVTSSSGTCTISYELGETLNEVEITVEEGAFPDCGGSNFLDLDSCIQSGLISSNPGITIDVDCGDLTGSVVLAIVYKSSSTYYILSNENSGTADFTINNGCFGKTASGTCNTEASLWAGWALTEMSSDINTLIYLKESYDSSDPTEAAMLYLITADDSYLTDLADLQKSDGSFDRNIFSTGLAVLALSESTDYDEAIEDAKSFLRDEQDDEGHWTSDIESTAMAIYGAFSDETVEAASCYDDIKNGAEEGVDCGGTCTDTCDGTEVIDDCSLDEDCTLEYGDDYFCDDGTCVSSLITSEGDCTTDDDCSGTNPEICLSGYCIESDCDYKGTCEYPEYNENAYNCASDCYCGDGICDDYEEDTGCSSDCEEETTTTSTTSTTTTTPDEGGSSLIIFILLFLILIGLGIGGYFAYTKGYLDTIIDKFKGGGGSSVYSPPTSQYKPFTSKLPPQGGAQQAPQQGNPFQR